MTALRTPQSPPWLLPALMAAAAMFVAPFAWRAIAAEPASTATVSTATQARVAPIEERMNDFRKPSAEELRSQLDELSFEVTQRDGTEPPFRNRYWDNKKHGLYVDIVSGEPLFASSDKFESGCGWPSFTKPIVDAHVTEHHDATLGMVRTEVRSKHGDSHLGHVFPDGPRDRGGLRYCINSAALRFVHRDDMVAEGYGAYLDQVEEV